MTDVTARISALKKRESVLREWKRGKLIHGKTGEPVPQDKENIAFAIATKIAQKVDPTLPKRSLS